MDKYIEFILIKNNLNYVNEKEFMPIIIKNFELKQKNK